MEAVSSFIASANILSGALSSDVSSKNNFNSGATNDRREYTAREAVSGGDGATSDTASTSTSGDTFTNSAQGQLSVPQARQKVLEGMYVFSGRINAQLREIRTSLNSGILTPEDAVNQEMAQNNPPASTENPKINKGGMLREAVDKNLVNFFPENRASAEKYGKMLDDLYDLSPEIYEKALIMLAMISRTDGESFKNCLEDLNKVIKNFKGAVGVSENGQVVGENAPEGSIVSAFSGVFQDYQAKINATTQGLSQSVQINFKLNVEEVWTQMRENTGQLSFNSQMELLAEQFGVSERCDPLILDLAGNGVDLSSVEDGVNFDLRGEGEKVRTAFIRGDDALLFLDKNGNHIADNGKELFGDQNGAANGYAELAKYDRNSDGTIDETDEIYAQLRIWQDINQDGECAEDEVQSLLAAGIRAIELAYENINQEDGKGNSLAQTAGFTRLDGSRGKSYDALLSYNAS